MAIQGSDTGSALSLEDFVGSAMDGAAWQGESSEEAPPTSTEPETPGTQSVEQAAGTSEEPTDPEGTDGQEATAADTNASIDPNTPPASDNEDAEDYEARFNAAPDLTYRVNGQEKKFEGMKLVDGGAMIRSDALPLLQTRLSERDALFENSQQQYRKYQDLEKLTAWKTQGADGKEQVVTGSQALEARQMALEKTTAILNTLAAVFDNPEIFRSLVTVNERNEVVPDAQALRYLQAQAELSATRAETLVRQQFQHQVNTQAQPQQSQTPDIQSVAPQVIENTAQQLGVTSLTSEDKTFLSSMLPRFVRPAIAEDLALSPTLKLGEPVVDASFGQLVQQQASIRSSSAKTVQQATTVSKENAAKLAAAKLGKTLVNQHTRNAPQRREAPKDQRAQDADDAFSMMQRAASGRF